MKLLTYYLLAVLYIINVSACSNTVTIPQMYLERTIDQNIKASRLKKLEEILPLHSDDIHTGCINFLSFKISNANLSHLCLTQMHH